ncbi:hypothetical protein IAU60_001051 [Kwoniella sp. DSM 27419]
MSDPKFSQYLLDKYADDIKVATTHPFLRQAGQGTIDPSALKEWLKQDYLYAYVGYIKFASAVLSKLPLDLRPTPNITRAVEVLAFSLSNVKRETEFFLSTAEQHGLGVFDGPAVDTASSLLGEYNPITRSYVDFLHATGALASIEEAFTLLWAMEICYFKAWSYAKTFQKNLDQPSEAQKALHKFVDNWTNDEFREFVDGCEEIMDGAEIQPETSLGKRCEEVFKRTLWLEQRFWPDVKEQ